MKIHNGEKTKKCNQCDFASHQTIDLGRHMKIHSGEKQINTTIVTINSPWQAI